MKINEVLSNKVYKSSDDTKIQLPKIKLWVYDKNDNQLIVMISEKVTIEARNDDWYQVGNFLIVKQFQYFKAHKICIIKDDDTVKAMKQVIEDDNESFVALEINLKVENSALSK